MGCCISGQKVLPKATNQSVRNSRRVSLKHGSEKNLKFREVPAKMLVDQTYTIFSSIGKGEFGHVLRAEHKQTKIPYAIKVIDLNRDIKAASLLEIKILREVHHDYVIRLYDVIKTSRRLYLVMDLATGGELMDRICLLGKFDECDAARVLFMILDGLRYLHSKGITHRDMKPQNILYYHPGTDSKIIITDFGLSAMHSPELHSPASYLMKTDCGTIEYMAPEVITRARYSNSVDMWSMGVIAYIVLSGRLPFPLNGNVMSTLRMICFCKYDFEGEPWNDVSDDAKDFIRSLLVYEPHKRLTASCALEHKWIKNKENSKQNLQRSISSNWSNSCVSLKNEKGLKRQAKANDSTDLCRNSAKKSTYGAIKSRDDELNKESARVVEGHKGSRRDVSTNRDYVPKNINVYNTCDAKKRSDPISGKVQKNDLKNEQENTMLTKTKIKGIEADQSGKDLGQKEPSTRQHSDTNVQRRQSSKVKSKVSPMILNPDKNSKQNNAANTRAQDCNGNLAFVKRLPPSQQHAKSCVEDTMSTQWNLEDLSKEERLLIEYTPLRRAKAGNKATLLPPIKSSRTISSKLDNTIELIN